MWSAGYVSLSGIFALIGLVLLSISLGTNHWIQHSVDRESLLHLASRNSTLAYELISINSSELYFSRDYGVLNKCFFSGIPQGWSDIFSNFSPVHACILTFTLSEYSIELNSTGKCVPIRDNSLIQTPRNSSDYKMLKKRIGTVGSIFWHIHLGTKYCAVPFIEVDHTKQPRDQKSTDNLDAPIIEGWHVNNMAVFWEPTPPPPLPPTCRGHVIFLYQKLNFFCKIKTWKIASNIGYDVRYNTWPKGPNFKIPWNKQSTLSMISKRFLASKSLVCLNWTFSFSA